MTWTLERSDAPSLRRSTSCTAYDAVVLHARDSGVRTPLRLTGYDDAYPFGAVQIHR